ncbi:GroES-like protein [Annulohypoxylon maeteangense]|uniref:GroES-like protein n=1 Tax=Annulohypoxylon maeteangense TaxID=1927788 RepID=UPI002008B461|nr:GroES-like protein [Annulohypoxylon maeteangense]KAI0888389.1 GroES-like protein [Annulohypoxylon maeteangense]
MTEAVTFVLISAQNVAFERRKAPKLRDEYDVKVHIEVTGICGSDIHLWQHGRIGDHAVTNRVVPGHESAGRVIEVGKKVKNVKVGDLVAVEFGGPCRRCDYCWSGAYNLCTNTLSAEKSIWDGTLQKYYVAASDFCYSLPSNISAEDGALVEPTAVAVQICKVANLRVGQTVLVFGCGPIGVLSQAVAKAQGAKKVIGVDISESRAAFAKSFGADDVFVPERPSGPVANSVDASRKMAEQIVDKFALGDGADVVLECTGAEPCVQAGVFATRKGGTYVQAGLGKENVVFPISTICLRGLNVKGSILYTTGCYPTAIDLIASGKINVRSLITHRFKFEQALDAFELVRQGQSNTMKVMIQGVP